MEPEGKRRMNAAAPRKPWAVVAVMMMVSSAMALLLPLTGPALPSELIVSLLFADPDRPVLLAALTLSEKGLTVPFPPVAVARFRLKVP